jgi:hypothetical protein
MGLDDTAFTHALGLAATFASGTFESRGGGMISFETTYPTTGFHQPAAAEGAVSLGSTVYAAACACVNRGVSIGRRRPPSWTTPLDGMQHHPNHGRCVSLAQPVRLRLRPDPVLVPMYHRTAHRWPERYQV